MKDHYLIRPGELDAYGLHQHVAALTGGARALWADLGARLAVRTEVDLGTGEAPRKPELGEVVGFELAACCCSRTRNKHVYYPLDDWKARHAWMRQRAAQYGFAILELHCKPTMLAIVKGGKRYAIDQTHFAGVLKVTDATRLGEAMDRGIGNTGRAFGCGLLFVH